MGLVVTFTLLMPLGHKLFRSRLFLPFHSDVVMVVSWQKCCPDPAQSALGESTSKTLIALQEYSIHAAVKASMK